jgi:maleamate amidohydrolase
LQGTPLIAHLMALGVDTVLLAGCQTSACVRATAMEAKTFRLKPVMVKECVGDRSAAAHVFSLADIAARFADITPLAETLEYIRGL